MHIDSQSTWIETNVKNGCMKAYQIIPEYVLPNNNAYEEKKLGTIAMYMNKLRKSVIVFHAQAMWPWYNLTASITSCIKLKHSDKQ